MNTGIPFTVLRDAILTYPTLLEELIPLFTSAPSLKKPTDAAAHRIEAQQSGQAAPSAR